MAFTTEEEEKIRKVLTAFDSAKLIKDLPNSGMSAAGKLIAVYDQATGKTQKILLTDAVNQAGSEWCGIRYKDANSETEVIGNLAMLRQIVAMLNLGGYLVQNDHSRKKLSRTTHLLLETGEAAVLDGTMGHYNWGWDKNWYYQNYKDGEYTCETMSFAPRKGFWNYYIPIGSRSAAGYAAWDATNSKLINVGTATIPVNNKPITTLQTAAHKNGDLWFASERVMWFITGFLKRLIFHNRNVQASWNTELTADGLHQGGMGNGYSDSAPWDNGYLPLNALVEDGDALELGTFQGDTTNRDGTAKTIDVSGIHNFYGLKNDVKYLWQMSENELLQCNSDGSQSLYIDDSVGNSVFDLTAITNHVLHSKGPAATAAGWVYPKNYNMQHLTFWPLDTGGSTSTYFGDGYYNPAATSVLRGVGLAGGADAGGHAGSMCAYGGVGVGDCGVCWSAFLCEWTEAFSTTPVLAA